MDTIDNKFTVRLFGGLFESITKSNPVLITVIVYFIFSMFSWMFDLSHQWGVISVIYLSILFLLLIFKPNRLQTENHQLMLKIIDNGLLGDKHHPQVSQEEYKQLYQPTIKKNKNSTKK